MVKGYWKRQNYLREVQWEQTRYLAALLRNIHRDSKAPEVSPEDLIPLSWDKKKEATPVKIPMQDKMKALEQKYKKK